MHPFFRFQFERPLSQVRQRFDAGEAVPAICLPIRFYGCGRDEYPDVLRDAAVNIVIVEAAV
jgi:hypothetical protein